MAMEARRLGASAEATANGAPCLLSVKPWPKIATGQPLAGRGPAGINRLKNKSSVPGWGGTLAPVGTAGMNTPPFGQCCPVNLPNARVPVDPGNPCNASRFPPRLTGASGPTLLPFTSQVTPAP